MLAVLNVTELKLFTLQSDCRAAAALGRGGLIVWPVNTATPRAFAGQLCENKAVKLSRTAAANPKHLFVVAVSRMRSHWPPAGRLGSLGSLGADTLLLCFFSRVHSTCESEL